MPWATDLVRFRNLQLIFKLLIVKQEVSAGKLVMCRQCLQHGLMSWMLHVASAYHYCSHPLTQPSPCPAATAPECSLPLVPILHDSSQSEKWFFWGKLLEFQFMLQVPVHWKPQKVNSFQCELSEKIAVSDKILFQTGFWHLVFQSKIAVTCSQHFYSLKGIIMQLKVLLCSF